MSSLIMDVIDNQLRHDRFLVHVFVRDGVSINGLAISRLLGGEMVNPNNPRQIIQVPPHYPRAIDIKCYSHTADLCAADCKERGRTVGRLKGPNLRIFENHLNSLFSGSSKAPKNQWAQEMGSAFPSHSATRWWSIEEVHEYTLEHMYVTENRLVTLTDFVKAHYQNDDFTGVHMTYLYNTLVSKIGEEVNPTYEESNFAHLIVELAVSVDVSKPIRELTYILEGDSCISLIVTDVVNRANLYLQDHWHTMDFVNVRRAIALNVEANVRPNGYDAIDSIEQAWIQYCKDTSERCINYFTNEIINHPASGTMQAAALANPDYMRRFPKSAAETREIIQPLVGRLITAAHLDNMIRELTDYKLQCTADWSVLEYSDQLQKIISFWSLIRKLPAWRKFAHLCYLLQVSSASVERAFSLLKYIYGDQETTCKQDLIEGKLMLRYNRRQQRET